MPHNYSRLVAVEKRQVLSNITPKMCPHLPRCVTTNYRQMAQDSQTLQIVQENIWKNPIGFV